MILRELEYAIPNPRNSDVSDERAFSSQKNTRRAINNSHVHDHHIRLLELDLFVPIVEHILDRPSPHSSFVNKRRVHAKLSPKRLVQQVWICDFKQFIATNIFTR
jgi:hypothetical protein